MQIIKYNTQMGENKLPVLVKERTYDYEEDVLNAPQKISDICKSVLLLDKCTEEYIYMLAMDAKCYPIGLFEISHGTVDASLITPREVFMKGLLCGAVYIVIIHNHPSGNSTPSENDKDITKQIVDAGSLVGIKVIDSIIIGNDYYSFSEHKCMTN